MADIENLDEAGPDLTGTVLDGRYRVLSALGRGGMGSVYLAEDQRVSRKVVVKVPHPELLAIPGFRKRFARELESLVQLEHPHIVKVLDSGTVDGLPYAVLQYLAGASLEDRLKSLSGRMPNAELLKWLFPVAETLDFMHREGWMHRDIKPANILFDRHGHVFLADFGIAKAMEGTGPQLTQTGRIPGSPLYMAPEVLTGEPVGPAYDQYSLGVVIYYIFSGEMPHMGETPFHLMTQKVLTPPTPLHPLAPHMPPRAAAAVMRAITLVPRERFPTCLAMAQELEQGLKEALASAEALNLRKPDAVPIPTPGNAALSTSSAETIDPSRAASTSNAETIGTSNAVTRINPADGTIYATSAAASVPSMQPVPSGRRRVAMVLAALLLLGLGLAAAHRAGLFPAGRPAEQPTSQSAHRATPQLTPAPVEPNRTEAYRKGCEAGVLEDCFELATLILEGTEGTQDYGKAVEPYRKACDGGLAYACSSLGVLYEQGTGVEQDYAKAMELYRKACDEGEPAGCSNLGGIYNDGLGVPKDFTKAAELFREACDGEWPDGCGNLGMLYEGGIGVPRDHDKAVELYREGCKDASDWSCGELKRLGLKP